MERKSKRIRANMQIIIWIMVKVNEETHDLRPKIPYTLTDPQNVDSEKKYIDNGIRTKTSPYLPPWESKSSKSENEDTVTPFLF